MESQSTALLDRPHLSQVQEELDGGARSSCFLPPMAWPSNPDEGDADGQEVMRGAGPAPCLKTEEDGGLLEEWGRIEADLRVSLRLETERQREAEFLRRRENDRLRTDLRHLSLSQRVAKPWVSSYFRRFPMHIYCLPVQAANHRARRGARTKTK